MYGFMAKQILDLVAKLFDFFFHNLVCDSPIRLRGLDVITIRFYHLIGYYKIS